MNRKEKKEARLQAEQERLEEVERVAREQVESERMTTPKSSLRKIKTLDDIANRHEQKKDEKKIQEAVKAERKKIAKEHARARRKYYILFGILLACVIAAVVACLYVSSESHYKAATELVLQEKYQEADQELSRASSDKATNLRAYVQIQENLDDYYGDAQKLRSKLSGISKFKNKKLNAQYQNACQQVNLAEAAQDDIDAIRLSSVSLKKKDEMEALTQEICLIESRYRAILETDKYDRANEAIQNMEDKTDTGIVMNDIANIGDVTLDSEATIKRARVAYERLSNAKKKKIINYVLLTDAENDYKTLQENQKEKLANQEKGNEVNE